MTPGRDNSSSRFQEAVAFRLISLHLSPRNGRLECTPPCYREPCQAASEEEGGGGLRYGRSYVVETVVPKTSAGAMVFEGHGHEPEWICEASETLKIDSLHVEVKGSLPPTTVTAM